MAERLVDEKGFNAEDIENRSTDEYPVVLEDGFINNKNFFLMTWRSERHRKEKSLRYNLQCISPGIIFQFNVSQQTQAMKNNKRSTKEVYCLLVRCKKELYTFYKKCKENQDEKKKIVLLFPQASENEVKLRLSDVHFDFTICPTPLDMCSSHGSQFGTESREIFLLALVLQEIQGKSIANKVKDFSKIDVSNLDFDDVQKVLMQNTKHYQFSLKPNSDSTCSIQIGLEHTGIEELSTVNCCLCDDYAIRKVKSAVGGHGVDTSLFNTENGSGGFLMSYRGSKILGVSLQDSNFFLTINFITSQFAVALRKKGEYQLYLLFLLDINTGSVRKRLTV